MTKRKICTNCVADNELRDEISQRGSLIKKCSICHARNVNALPATDRMIKRIFRALVRLNYSEWAYNEHLGGESLQTLVFEQDKIFRLPKNASELNFEEAFLVLEDEWYPDDPADIELGGGYWAGGILSGLLCEMDTRVESLLHKGFDSNYFDLESEVLGIIETIRTDITQVLPIDSKYCRARVGVKARLKKETYDPLLQNFYSYLPYSNQEIAHPPIPKATEGRLNRARVSILYLASDSETAVAELRPHSGHLVSAAEFISTRPLTIANFADQDIRNFLRDDRLETLRTILSFSSVLNLPVQPEHHALYLLTQLFSDCIRKAGFDGVAFRSSLGKGINLACFKPDVFKQIPDSESLFEVKSLEYKLATKTPVPQDYDKDKYESVADDALSTLFDGLARRL